MKWKWTLNCAKAFKATKQALVSSNVLIHYNPQLPITLAGDASAYGLGAVISHTLPDGSEHLPQEPYQKLSKIMHSWKKKQPH